MIAIMLVSDGISQSDSTPKAVEMCREYKFVYHSESHRDRHYVSMAMRWLNSVVCLVQKGAFHES